MIVRNLVAAVFTYIGYFFLCVVWPSVFLRRFVEKMSTAFRIIFYETAANVYIFITGYIISYLHIYSRFTVYFVLIFLPVIVRSIIRRRIIKERLKKAAAFINDYRDKIYGIKHIRRSVREYLKKAMVKQRGNIQLGKMLDVLFVLMLLVFCFCYFNSEKLCVTAYAAADEEVHTYWITSLMHNQPFPSGMYPHAFHYLIAAISSVCFISPIRGLFVFAMLSAFLVFSHLYALFRKIFSSKAAVCISFTLYLTTSLLANNAKYRFHFSIPMEFSLVIVGIALFALLVYAECKNRDDAEGARLSLLMFALAVMWSFQSHFYMTILIIILCVAFALAFLAETIRKKYLLKLLGAGLAAIAISVSMFVPGFIGGYKFEQSIAWALQVMNTSNQDRLEAKQEKAAEAAEAAEKEARSAAAAAEVQSGDAASGETEAPAEKAALQDTEYRFFGKLPLRWVKLFFKETVSTEKNGKINLEYIEITEKELTVLFGAEAFLLAFGILGFLLTLVVRRKEHLQYRKYLFAAFSWLAIFAVSMAYFYDLPVLLEMTRALSMLAIFSIPCFAAPIEFAMRIIGLIPEKWRVGTVIAVLVDIAALLCSGYLGAEAVHEDKDETRAVIHGGIIQEGDSLNCLDFVEKYEKHKWTVISTTRDLSIVRFDGYHTEIIDLMEDVERKSEVYIPTRDIFVIIDTDFVSPKYARTSLRSIDVYGAAGRSELYTDCRNEIMSVLYYWMEKIKTVYPSETTVYYDDGRTLIYRIEQDEYFLLNLSVDYSDVIEGA